MNQLLFRTLTTAFLLFVLICVPSIASADGIPWVLSGVTFDDGGTASGSFNYDAVTNTYSSIDITTTAGSAFPGATYTSLSGVFGSSSTGTLLGAASGDLTDTPLLLLMYNSALTNLGGTVTFSFIGEGTCNVADCTSGGNPNTLVRSDGGEVVGTPVSTPEPAALLLLGMGLVALLVSAAMRKVSLT